MAEQELDAAIAEGKKDPENIRQTDENFASSEQLLAEVGLDDWLADFDKKFPRKE